MKSTKIQFALLCILLLSFILRIHDLDGESLWLDEGVSIKLARLTVSDIVNYLASEVDMPSHFIFLHYWIALFGDSEFSARFPSVIFGCLSVFMIYKVGALVFDWEVGVFSALLLAFSVLHVHRSRGS